MDKVVAKKETRIVEAAIDAAARAVWLKGRQPALTPPQTFDVVEDDTVKWIVTGAPATATVQIRFVGFPDQRETPLFKDGRKVLEAKGGVILSGPVGPAAAAGPYRYVVELVEGERVTSLECLWGDGAAARPMGMGGGVHSGGPPEA